MPLPASHSLLKLTLAPGFGPTLIGRILEAAGSVEDASRASSSLFASVRGISQQKARELKQWLTSADCEDAVAEEIELMASHGVQAVTMDEPSYPHLLKLIPDPPPLLYIRGELEREDALGLGIVGSRRCTQYGREQADRFASQCAQAGLTIVSGGAIGIDGAAHAAAVRIGGRTIAVIGSGLVEPYPQRHRDLFDQITHGQGAIISELPMKTAPVPENFPRRNRIISGLSLGILVIEAALRSGALITARLCIEDHGRECLAVPGRVDSKTSAGCHKLIRDGEATLVTNAADVLDALGDAGQTLKAELMDEHDDDEASSQVNLFEQNLTDSQRRIVESLQQPRGLDDLATVTSLPVPKLQADLTMLQIRGLIGKENGKFARKR